MRVAVAIAIALCFALSGCGARADADLDRLIDAVGSQTGTTEGYPQAVGFTIPDHEPARTIIDRFGSTAAPHVLAQLETAPRRWLESVSDAWWYGRSSAYQLTREDVLICILRRIAGRDELPRLLAILERQRADFEQINRQTTRDAQAFASRLSAMLLTQRAIEEIRARVGAPSAIE